MDRTALTDESLGTVPHLVDLVTSCTKWKIANSYVYTYSAVYRTSDTAY